MMKILRILTAIIWLALALLPVNTYASAGFFGSCCSLEQELRVLDDAVANSQETDQRKLQEILSLKKREGACISVQEKCEYYKTLYDAYLKFMPDSAEHYAMLGIETARRNALHDMELQFRLDRLRIYVLRGETAVAEEQIKKLPQIEQMPTNLQPKAAMTILQNFARTHYIDVKSRMDFRCKDAWAKYGQYIPDGSWQKLFYETMSIDKDNTQAIECELKATRQPSLKAAMLYLALGRLYGLKKDYDHLLCCMIRSAVNDIQNSNKEAGSLLYLIYSPYIHLDADRAMRYMMLCSDNVKAFNDRFRSLQLAKAQTIVVKKYQEELRRKTYVLYAIIALLVIALAGIVFLLCKVVRHNKQKDELLRRIEEMNKSLHASVAMESEARAELSKVNQLLKKEIDYHNENFFNVYQLISKYIIDTKEFKKKMYNLITAGKADTARRELSSNTITDKYLKNFFEHFDKAFLLSHPDFVERFNQLLKPDSRIQPQEDGTLTPELRIYALVSIGITDSVSIAKFLHYSTQTVYNYRLKVRHASQIPEKDFAQTVAHMYDDKS